MLPPPEQVTAPWRTDGDNETRSGALPGSERGIVGVARGSIPRTRGPLRRRLAAPTEERSARSRADHPANGDRAITIKGPDNEP